MPCSNIARVSDILTVSDEEYQVKSAGQISCGPNHWNP